MTTLRIERYQVVPDHRAAFEMGTAELVDAMRGQDGFLWADATASLQEQEVVTLAMEWRTPDALDAFTSSPAYEGFRAAAEVAIREDPSVRVFSSSRG